jgi:hypothetical protein
MVIWVRDSKKVGKEKKIKDAWKGKKRLNMFPVTKHSPFEILDTDSVASIPALKLWT